MSLEGVRGWWQRRDRWEKLALVSWLIVIGAIEVRTLVMPTSKQNVYPVFSAAGLNWRNGANLYIPDEKTICRDDVYRYSPTATALMVPLSFLDDKLGSILWRLLTVVVYLVGLAWWARSVLPRSLTSAQWGLLLLLILPLSIGSINNGQSNPLVLGLLLATVAAASAEFWFTAGCCVALATLFKIYPLALGLLLLLVYPRKFSGRLALALAAGVLLPFVLQDPVYVARQCVDWVRYLQIDDRSEVAALTANRDLRLLLRVWVATPSNLVYLAIQLLGAAAAAGLCFAAARADWPRRRLLTLVLAASCAWMTLLGPATESSTYILLAPTLAWGLLEAYLERRPWALRALFGASLTGFVLTQVANWLPAWRAPIHALGTHPFAALLLVAAVVWQEFEWSREKESDEEAAEWVPATRAA